jgi:hypothetical protein
MLARRMAVAIVGIVALGVVSVPVVNAQAAAEPGAIEAPAPANAPAG